MDERTRGRLQDIVDDADELAGQLAGLTAASFRRDRGKQRIAERLLEIAGEAANHVPVDVTAGLDGDWPGLRRMRVLLAHAYHRVDPDQLWLAATVDLPRLAEAARGALRSRPD